MNRIYSNGGNGDFVINPFNELAADSKRLYLAAPYFTHAEPVLEAIHKGKSVQLLVGLNAATDANALKEIHGHAEVAIRYLTHRFHAKIYVFDDAALIGSSNLTQAGLLANREAVICLDRPEDAETIDDAKALFHELWETGQVLTNEKLDTFERAKNSLAEEPSDLDATIEKELGRAEPPNIDVESRKISSERVFLEGLRQEVYEQYRPAFDEVSIVLNENDLRRDDLASLGVAIETNRFLNYLRLTHIIGDQAYQAARQRDKAERCAEIKRFGLEWVDATDNKVPEDYFARLETVARVFGTDGSFASAGKNEITEGLMSIHAFTEQFRFVKGGYDNLPTEFWKLNSNNVARVKNTLSHLMYGSGDFIQRLHDVLYDPSMKLGKFGRFCALELYGTVNPTECPPMNGRMAKALRYLGFAVRPT